MARKQHIRANWWNICAYQHGQLSGLNIGFTDVQLEISTMTQIYDKTLL